MSITPISSVGKIANINEIAGKKTTAATGTDVFKSMLHELIDNVNKTEATAAEDILKIAAGESDDLHTIMINAEKAELAVLTAVQIRNKVLDAYKEIMNISL